MSFFNEIRKRMGVRKEAEKGTWPRQVKNNELPPERRYACDDDEPQPMRHGMREVKIENGRIVPPNQPKRRLPQESRYIRNSDEHNSFLHDGGLPPRRDDE
jgi:hypothetical protein